MAEYKKIMVAHDFSPHASAALEAAQDLAGKLGADLLLVHVFHHPEIAYASLQAGAAPAPTFPLELRQSAEQALADVASSIEIAPGSVTTRLVDGASVDGALVEVCKDEAADLLVMGTHGRTGLAHAFLGSVAERTLRRAPCPVLTVQGTESENV